MLLGELTPTSLKTSTDCCNLRAIDKDLTTATTVKTDNGHGELWLNLEFDKTHFIDKVVIHYMFYTDWFDSEGCCCCCYCYGFISSLRMLKGQHTRLVLKKNIDILF